jgi:predicted metal-dependent phosphoesterase TrpH
MPNGSTLPLYDLHLHTYWSYDATAHLDSYLKAAVEKGVGCLAITEHHTADGFAEVRAAARSFPGRLIPSAELSVTTSVGSIDLLCYNLPWTPPPALAAVYDQYHAWQQEYGAGTVRAMQQLGHDYTDQQRHELLQSYRPPQTLAVQGWTHVQNGRQREYFIRRGFIADAADYSKLSEAIRKTGLVPPYPDVKTVTTAVKEAGALIVIAHPRGYFQVDNRQRMDLLRRECLLDGIECRHPSVPPELGAVYRAYCLEHGLCSTAGSDTHTDEAIDQTFGQFSGDPVWLEEFLERIGPPQAL